MSIVSSQALPSQQSADDLIGGEWSALPSVVASVLARASLISIGLSLAGALKIRSVWLAALFGALAIEVFVLGWAYWHRAPE